MAGAHLDLARLVVLADPDTRPSPDRTSSRCFLQFISKIGSTRRSSGSSPESCTGIRRRNASSASDSGLRFVAKTTSTLNGISNLLAGVQRQVVDAALERHDPPVQQVARRDALPAEVVDDEHAAVGLHLHRRFVELRDRVEASGRASRASARRRPSTTGRRMRSQRRSCAMSVTTLLRRRLGSSMRRG